MFDEYFVFESVKMISKEMKGKGFRGALCYIYETRAKAEWICGTTVSLAEPKKLTKEFDWYSSLRPEITDPVFHGILSVSRGEKLTNQQWKECVGYYLKEQGFNDNFPFVAVKHKDKSNEHIHIIVSRVGIDGSLNRLSYSKYKGMQVCRTLEKMFNLRQLETSKNAYGKEIPFKPADRKKTTIKERGKAERLSAKNSEKKSQPTREKLQNFIDEVLQEKTILFDDFCLKLNEKGVAISPLLQQDDKGKIVLKGLKYELEGLFFKASSLGTAYRVENLLKRGLLLDDLLLKAQKDALGIAGLG